MLLGAESEAAGGVSEVPPRSSPRIRESLADTVYSV